MNSLQNPTHQPSSGDVFPCLDGLRCFAILCVVLYHTLDFNPSSPIKALLFALTRAGWMGVPVFFVLSGFLISHTVFKSPNSFSAYAYTARRIGRIAPPFLLSLIVFASLSFYWKHPDNLIVSILAYATTFAHFQGGFANVNPVYWFLMIEIHFYIVLPLLYFGLRRISKHPEWLTFSVFLIVPALIRVSSYLPPATPNVEWITHANLFPRALDNFALGMLFSIIFLRFRTHPNLLKVSSMLASLGFLLMLFTYLCYGFLEWRFSVHGHNNVVVYETFRYLSAIVTFLLLFVIFTPPSQIVHRALDRPTVNFVGLISYEWFLFHQPPVIFLTAILGPAKGNIAIYLLKTLAPTVLTFGFSVLLYFYFSAPILARIKAHLKNRDRLRSKKALAGTAERQQMGV